jgi:hypothetical protein
VQSPALREDREERPPLPLSSFPLKFSPPCNAPFRNWLLHAKLVIKVLAT